MAVGGALATSVGSARAAGWLQGDGANLNGVPLDRVLTGFGDRLVWIFGRGDKSFSQVSSVDLVLGGGSLEQADPKLAEQLDRVRLEHGLRNARLLAVWVTPAWQPEWFPPGEIQRALDNGITPVFLDWYFGDRLLGDDVKTFVHSKLDAYAEHSRRLGRYLGQFDGDVLVVVEPELNKPAIEAWPEFGKLLREHGIAQIRAGIDSTNRATARRTTAFFGTALTDNGLRASGQPDDVYGSKSRGDSYGWTLSRPLLEALRTDLDFIGFQQLLSQFHRDPQNPDHVVAEDPDELGLADVPTRLVNYARYLQEQLGLPILLPYLGFPTSRWNDANRDGVVEPSEVTKYGWQREIGGLLAGVREALPDLHEAGVVGVGSMMLFDDPVHDLGGYQYLSDNEYALGLVGTNARNGRPNETLGLKLTIKQEPGRPSYVELLFQPTNLRDASP